MQYKFFPQTEEDIALMLDKIGVKSIDDLFAELPEGVRFNRDYNLPEAKSELEIRRFFDALGAKNKQLTCFAGGGVYDHYTPSIVPNLISRSEFLTSYTPYQAEISQGTLHYIFEFQSMMAEMTQMDVANASMYDGTTAAAEAVLMAVAAGKKANKVLISQTVDPKTLDVIKTYAHVRGVELVMVGEKDGVTDQADLDAKLAEGGVAGVLVQQPNYYGNVEDYDGLADRCHANKALLIMDNILADLAWLKTPGELGADIAVGDCQSMGMPMAFGGPYCGYMCCTNKLVRKMPGRIVGKTVDQNGERVFVLTLQAREQHIRREKATSNICSNQSLMALFTTIYMSVMGKEGVKEAAQRSFDGAHYMAAQLVQTGRFAMAFDQPFFNEFCVRYDGDVDQLQARLIDNGFLGGIKVGDDRILFAVTEKRTKEEIDRLVALTNL